MLSQAQRTTILELSAQGVSRREIARMLGISRPTVRKVVRSNSTEVPEIPRAEKAEPYRQRILELFSACKENLVRVHEELTAEGAALSYAALTAFCRKQGIGQALVVAAGQYHFDPGEEMQHDTSPHEVQLAGKKRKVQTASAVLCYSRMLFFQCYPTFQRFDCKVFLTEVFRNQIPQKQRQGHPPLQETPERGEFDKEFQFLDSAAFGRAFHADSAAGRLFLLGHYVNCASEAVPWDEFVIPFVDSKFLSVAVQEECFLRDLDFGAFQALRETKVDRARQRAQQSVWDLDRN